MLGLFLALISIYLLFDYAAEVRLILLPAAPRFLTLSVACLIPHPTGYDVIAPFAVLVQSTVLLLSYCINCSSTDALYSIAKIRIPFPITWSHGDTHGPAPRPRRRKTLLQSTEPPRWTPSLARQRLLHHR